MKKTNQELQDLGLGCYTLSAMPNPGILAYAAAIQDYSERSPWMDMFRPLEDGLEGILGTDCGGVRDPKNPSRCLSEHEAQRRVVEHCLKHKHWGPLEHPQIFVNFLGFPHSMMQQLRTHRTGISFDVQSGRYTGDRIVKVHTGELKPEDVFFVRPPGIYQDKGQRIEWTEEHIEEAKVEAREQAKKYAFAVEYGMPKEMARDLYINYGIRQNFVMSCNLRTGFHLLDMRFKKDAELEIQWAMQLFLVELRKWAPLIVTYYEEVRAGKNMIAP